MAHGNRVDNDRHRLTIDLPAELADWLVDEATVRRQGREVIIERALRDHRRVVERDRVNPRPRDHRHFCLVCSDGTERGPGCINCRETGMDQTPCIDCPGRD